MAALRLRVTLFHYSGRKSGLGKGLTEMTIRYAEDRCTTQVRLTEEEFAAIEGWRRANRFASRDEAMRELIRLGLLSEIGRIYRAVTRRQQGDGEASGNA